MGWCAVKVSGLEQGLWNEDGGMPRALKTGELVVRRA